MSDLASPAPAAFTRRLGAAGPGDLHAVLSDDGWRLEWRRGDAVHEVVGVDPTSLAALLLNRELREAPGAPRPEAREATAARMAGAEDLLGRLRAGRE